jgi:hypothetical protein
MVCWAFDAYADSSYENCMAELKRREKFMDVNPSVWHRRMYGYHARQFRYYNSLLFTLTKDYPSIDHFENYEKNFPELFSL